MAKITFKRYQCDKCGHIKKIDTNHFGPCWSLDRFNTCPECPPYAKYPEFGGLTLWNCLDKAEEKIMSESITSTKANELIQLAIDDCDNWEEWDRDDRSNFENMGTNLEKVQAHLADSNDVLEQALFQLNICLSQIEDYSENTLIIDPDTDNTVTVQSVRDFLTDNLDKS